MTLVTLPTPDSPTSDRQDFPLGTRYGRDGNVVRRMLATVALKGGDAVILDLATGPYNVTKAATANNTPAFGLVLGGVGITVAAIGAEVDVVVQGTQWSVAQGTVTAGDIVSTAGTTAGRVAKASGGTRTYSTSATLTPAAVAQATTAEQSFTGFTPAPAVGDTIAPPEKPTAQAGLGIVGARVIDATHVGITFANVPAGGNITPTGGEVYKAIVTSVTAVGLPGGVLGVALTTATSGNKTLIYVQPR